MSRREACTLVAWATVGIKCLAKQNERFGTMNRLEEIPNRHNTSSHSTVAALLQLGHEPSTRFSAAQVKPD